MLTAQRAHTNTARHLPASRTHRNCRQRPPANRRNPLPKGCPGPPRNTNAAPTNWVNNRNTLFCSLSLKGFCMRVSSGTGR
ncbi:hypothetical protein NDU88_003663 [Pleurodeles waltl]|uniref:Uncharacterized protein n=1 Tax=Pleurodeles waltl TaxID=8319 RepID=A0AAV7NIR0_PLEWA|nr:hypothetical protein NDU88_003663 [Pleurodeles waltl]